MARRVQRRRGMKSLAEGEEAAGPGRPRELEDRVYVAVYVDRTERDALAELAARRGQSVSELVRDLIRRELARPQ